ncbi:unnamed protein product [Enterobius vermicularis]|uniref:CID domain-containing protein n=1 Tax=Enterobius vermicularis TaxID=51028 RepID=A0A0N4V917_ENTVE|nr:unnamed protein product [Enterobius vermicularis]
MAGFSESAMTKRLESLTTTSQSIQTVSMWLLHHQKNHADEIVQLWLKEVKQEVRPVRLVNLLYLANDVIQNSRKQSPGFMALFYTVLEPAFKQLIASFPEAIANPVYLKGIKNEKQARALLERINEADPIVKNYCKRSVIMLIKTRSLKIQVLLLILRVVRLFASKKYLGFLTK